MNVTLAEVPKVIVYYLVSSAPGSSQDPQEPMNNGAANAVSQSQAVNGVQNGLSANGEAAKFVEPLLAYEGGEPFMMKTGPMKPQHVAGTTARTTRPTTQHCTVLFFIG